MASVSGKNVCAADVERLLPAARHGSPEACDRLWQLVRNYLLMLANRELPAELRGQLGGSDLVQETLYDAQRNLARFEGRTHGELLAWLRRILLNHLADARRKQTRRNEIQNGRERSLAAGSSLLDPQSLLVAETDSPSHVAMSREQTRRIARVLATLSADHAQIIRLRTWERLSFVDIGESLGCSPDAARKLWVRAIERFERMWAQQDR